MEKLRNFKLETSTLDIKNDQDIIVKLSKIDKVFIENNKRISIFKNLNLNIKKNEVLAIQGPSGCGKTTLLNLISGLDFPNNGEISLFGSKIEKLSDTKISSIRAHKIGILFQKFNLLNEFTVIENIEFPMKLTNIPIKERINTLGQLLDMIDMTEKKNFMPKELSGGEQQRVAITRALANNPSLILLDEPTGDLDHATSVELIDKIIEIVKSMKKTMIMATHDDCIANKAEKIYYIENGTISQK